MTNYYFEQIGDEIRSLRENLAGNSQKSSIKESRQKMNKLIEAFNTYSDKKVTFEEVIPGDLRDHFKTMDFNMDILN